MSKTFLTNLQILRFSGNTEDVKSFYNGIPGILALNRYIAVYMTFLANTGYLTESLVVYYAIDFTG